VIGSATLVGAGPFISVAVRRRALRRGVVVADDRDSMGPTLTGLSGVIGVYGGYFGAAQGVLLVAVLALGLDVPLSAVNGLKNVAVATANIAASVVFVFFAPLNWPVVGLIAIGSVVGGYLGAHLGRRLPPTAFRVLVVVFGYVVGIKLLLS
jgi:uncharacterized membrane protein YfcA